MTKIKFGTDGWRAIIAKDYTVDNVKRVATATAQWIKSQKEQPTVVLGHDCRFAGELFAQTTAQVLGAAGIKVLLAKGFVSTPMVSLGIVRLQADLGIVITASHNPPSYNGFKLKSHFGGPTPPKDIEAVEALIPDEVPQTELPSLNEMQAQGLLEYVDLETLYLREVRQAFDLPAIQNSGMRIAYDAMYGAGQRVMQRMLTNVEFLHCTPNPGFEGQAPEPIHRNLQVLSRRIAQDPSLAVGLANDGDADRIGLYNRHGEFVDSHHILLLLIHYLHHYKGLTGKVIVTFSVTDKVKKLCAHYGLDCEVTKIGFKYIAEKMLEEDVLVGGEESGGIAAKGHIPERDGIWIGMLLFEFMAKTGKSLEELIQEVYAITGAFSFDRDDLHLTDEKKHAIIAACKANKFTHIGEKAIRQIETIDGFKFHLDEGEWVMVRPSGTEPVLRVYAQAETPEKVRAILDAAHKTLQA